MPNIDIDSEILKQQRQIKFDMKEFTVELLCQKFNNGSVYTPYYQRNYIWDIKKKKKFVESVILGLPIPFLFGADREKDGNIEIIDGVQRLNTLVSFTNNEFKLEKLEKLDFLDGISFSDLPNSQQQRFLNRTIRMIVLDQGCTEKDKFDVFERINTTSAVLKDSELRKGAYFGSFWKFIEECSDNLVFQKICPLSDNKNKRGEREELILRFFAYSDKYETFTHSVNTFLNDYLKDKNEEYKDIQVPDKYKNEFNRMLNFVQNHIGTFAKIRNGTSENTTPRVRFEAIAVGVNLALRQNPNLSMNNLDWLNNDTFKKLTTSDASNNKDKLVNRIEYVRDSLLGS